MPQINITHLKHIGPPGLAYITNMYNIRLNNIIPHTWKLANNIPITKPNKDMNMDISYIPISLLSMITKKLENTLLPYITNNIPHISTQHSFKSNHLTSTSLHNINNTITTGFNQNKPPECTLAVALDMIKAFDTVNIHTVIQKLHTTSIPHTNLKFTNYIEGRKTYTTFRNKTSTQRQFKAGVPQGGVISPILLNIYTSDTPTPQAPVKLTTYADEFTITSTQTT